MGLLKKLRITNCELRIWKTFLILHSSLLILIGCSGIRLRLQAPLTSVTKGDKSATEIIPPLEKIFETTTASGFSKDAGVISDSLLFFGTFNGEVKVYNVTNGTSYGYFDAGTAVSGAPSVDGFRVFIPLVKDQNSLVAYDLQDKHIDWKVNIGNIESSPLVFEENIFVVTTESKLYSIRKRTGEINWTFENKTKKTGSRAHCSVVSDGFDVYFGNDEGTLYSVTLDSGKLLWKFESDRKSTRLNSSHVSESRMPSSA